MSNLTQSRPNYHSPRWYGWLGLILALPVGLVVGWILLRRRMEKQGFSNIPAEIELPVVARDHQENHPPATPPVNHAKIDDLTIIRGIGGKVSAYLHSIGIHTFEDLAKADPANLREQLLTHGFRLSDPALWMEQARLAAAGDWEGLQAAQDRARSQGR